MVNINLVEAPANTELEVLEINANDAIKKRLISMGIHPGDKVIKYTTAPWGPLLVKNTTLNCSKMAICRALASTIRIGYDNGNKI